MKSILYGGTDLAIEGIRGRGSPKGYVTMQAEEDNVKFRKLRNFNAIWAFFT
ncbi:MAG: hypothetical protein L0213_15195 [Candidatus Dadabacteria bacterium]|nr:hypothetical protein [Candidatus Dadabacteria bacterium]